MTRLRLLRWPAAAALGCAVLLPAAPAYGLACAPASPFASAAAVASTASAVARAALAGAPARTAELRDDPQPPLAGSAAGAGRKRPGRPVTEAVNPEAALAPRPLPLRPEALPPPAQALPPAQPPQERPQQPRKPHRPGHPQQPPSQDLPWTGTGTGTGTPPPAAALGTGPNARAADLAAHILPLGTGFALMGVGLGFIGMRLRRG
ncbi:hypothetical protein [Streptomyces venezuelae]|uniref:hypothetical protein n=1 Tax=Streptomyces venezuelae TaxID=54571 RepID=UPI00123B362E|nr:hypothetical protein [Streptomyces venezuelae]